MIYKSLEEILAEEERKYRGVLVPVKASALERLVVTSVRPDKLHPNPDDEFCFPNIGPNHRILSDYESKFRRFGMANEEPLMVEKVHPDGYMILNGHHRWAAAMRAGISKIPVKIINLTMETDIQKMMEKSVHDKRVTLDLDEVVFCSGDDMLAEKPLKFPYNKTYKERIRLGIPALLHNLGMKGYDIWVYSAEYYSMDYISDYFKRYSAKVDGIITGTKRKAKDSEEAKKRTEKLIEAKYKETLHIDNNMVLRTFSKSKEFEEYTLKSDANGWSKEVMDIIKGLK